MPRRRTKAKSGETIATDSPQPAEVMTSHRKTPVWHRQYLRRLASHGDKELAAKQCKVTMRHVYRVARAKPRFRKAMQAAERIALQAHADRMEKVMLDVAENGYRVPIVSAGKVVAYATKRLPNLMKMVAEVTVPIFAEARDKRDKLKQRAQQESVSNTLNVSILAAHADDPVIRQALLMISDRLTSGELPKAIEVTPAEPTDDAE
jgi:hypothetical protein